MFNQYFENRQLKKTIIELDETIARKDNVINEKQIALNNLHSTKDDLGREHAKVKKELTKVKKMVRDQTGADLLVNALQELGVVPKPEKCNDAFSEQERLQRQMSAAQHDHSWSRNQLGGLQGMTGMGSY